MLLELQVQLHMQHLIKLIDSSVNHLVRVSCGETSAVHQIISIRDADDILTVQYPFVSMQVQQLVLEHLVVK